MNDIIREFKMRNFTVRAVAVEDSDVDLSWDDDGSVRAGLESGRFCHFGVVVTVYCRGSEVGQDSLWGCIYESPRDFMDHKGIRHYSPNPSTIPEGSCGSYFSDLIRGAIAEARKSLSGLKTVYVRN